MQQLILGTGTAIWWLTEPHWLLNLSNGVTDTLESNSLLIYLIQVKGIYTQKVTLVKTRNYRGKQKKALLLVNQKVFF
jgi:hypothetical protein